MCYNLPEISVRNNKSIIFAYDQISQRLLFAYYTFTGLQKAVYSRCCVVTKQLPGGRRCDQPGK
jgi:hypothetical protein